MSVRKTKNGYKVDVRDADGVRHRRTFRTKAAADAWEREMIDQREQGVLPIGGNGTLSAFLKEWENTVRPGLRANTWQGYAGAVRKHIEPRFGAVKIKQIDQRLVQEWVNELHAELDDDGDRKYSARTIEFQFSVLSTIMKLAAEYGAATPIRKRGRGVGGVRLPPKTKKQIVPPTIAQIERLCEIVDPRFGIAGIRVAGYCGLRQSEIFGLHPSAIDFDNHRIHVYRTVEHATGSLGPTKNGKDRWVPMFDLVETALRAHMAEYPNPDFVFHLNDRRFDSSRFHHVIWKQAKLPAGIPDEIVPHDLRHSAASIMIAAGWDVKRVQMALGHHSAAFTLDQYGHLFPDDDNAARATLDNALAQAIRAAKDASGETRTPTPSQAAAFETALSTDSSTEADADPTTEGAAR